MQTKKRARGAFVSLLDQPCSKRSWLKIVAWCPIFLTSTYFTNTVHTKCQGCPTLWGCSMVCLSKNIANCSKNLQFLLVMCALCAPHVRAVHALCRHDRTVPVCRVYCVCVGGGGVSPFRLSALFFCQQYRRHHLCLRVCLAGEFIASQGWCIGFFTPWGYMLTV